MDPNVKKFNTELNELLTMLEKKARGDNETGLVYQIQNQLKLARAVSYENVATGGVEMFLAYNDDIQKKNEKMLLEGNTANVLKNTDPSERKLYVDLIELVRAIYKRSGGTDREKAWGHLTVLRDTCFACNS